MGATIAALTGLSGKHVLIAGGVAKGADFSELAAAVIEHCRAVVLIGQDAPEMEKVLQGSIDTVSAKDMQAAVVAANTLAQPGDNVLLAPACASFDMYQNFEHRGDDFRRCVGGLN